MLTAQVCRFSFGTMNILPSVDKQRALCMAASCVMVRVCCDNQAVQSTDAEPFAISDPPPPPPICHPHSLPCLLAPCAAPRLLPPPPLPVCPPFPSLPACSPPPSILPCLLYLLPHFPPSMAIQQLHCSVEQKPSLTTGRSLQISHAAASRQLQTLQIFQALQCDVGGPHVGP